MVRLPEDDPETFATYINFVYTNNVATNPSDGVKASSTFSNEFVDLCKLYVLSEKLCDMEAKNATVHAILATNCKKASDGHTYAPGTKAVSIMYAGTLKDCPGRLLMADMWTITTAQYLASNADELPRDFLVDLAVAFRKDRPTDKESVAKRADADRYLEKLE